MKGYTGRLLRVNLTDRKISIEEPPEIFYRHYLGGRGFIIHTLLKEVPKGINPLCPKNKLIFSLGPFTGHPLIGSARSSVGAKSPLTGGFGESEAGGYWGTELKKSGYDGIIVEGKSAHPVYLWINDGKVAIRDARNLWGSEIGQTEKAIRQELGNDKIRIATIGPAGENLVRYACIANDIFHVAGRTGMGAVMGSKKLKAIAIRGLRRYEVADMEKIKELSRWMAHHCREKSVHWRFGTGSTIEKYESTGNLPIRNFSGGRFPGVSKIAPQRLFEKSYVEKMEGCYGCPIKCKRRIKIDKPWKIDSTYGGPEYETLAALGSNCGIDNLEALIKANELCNRYGIDTISAGVAISFAMECFENGILTREDTDGIEISFGNFEAMLKMLENIALRKGFGDILAEGTKRASEKIGKRSDEFAIHVKGEEIPMHEPRYKQAMALHYSVHPAGADHATGIHDDAVINKMTGNDLAKSISSTELSPRKAQMLYDFGISRQMRNYLGLCLFVPWSEEQISEAMKAATGWTMSQSDLFNAVERGMTLARIFNIREGFSKADDCLPHKFTISPSEGPLKGVIIDSKRLGESQTAYFKMLGWDESGIPTFEKLVKLEIKWAYKYLKMAD